MARTGASSSKTTTESQTPTEARGRKALIPILIGVAVVAGISALVLLDPPLPGEEYPSMGNRHLAAVDEEHEAYNSKPGSSGPHFGGLADWAVHETEVPNELWIHNLEDRGVVFVYNCTDCPELAQGLGELRDELQGNSLVTPYSGEIASLDGTQYRAAAVAWTRIYFFNELTNDSLGEIKAFYRAYEGLDHHAN